MHAVWSFGAVGAGKALVLAGVAEGPCTRVADVARAHAAGRAHRLRRRDLVDGGGGTDEVEVGREVEPVGIIGGAGGRAVEALLVGRDAGAVVVGVVVGWRAHL